MKAKVLATRLTRYFAVATALAGSLLAAAPAEARVRPPSNDWGLLGPQPELGELSWLSAGVHQSRPFRLAPDRSLSLLAHYLSPSQNHISKWRTFFRGQYGFASWGSQLSLNWSLDSAVPEPARFSVSTRGPCPKWQAPRSVNIARYDGIEQATLPLIDCDGGIAPDAIDVVSVLARGA